MPRDKSLEGFGLALLMGAAGVVVMGAVVEVVVAGTAKGLQVRFRETEQFCFAIGAG